MASRISPVTILGAWAAGHPSDHPAAAYDTARSAFVDTVGCILAGAGEESTRRTIKSLAHWTGGTCHADAASIGGLARLETLGKTLILGH